jgi:glycerol uptake facilitator-like aquaporin
MSGTRLQPARAWRASLVSTLSGLAVVGGGAWLAATWVRYGLIERHDLGSICDAVSAPWWCDARRLVIQAFLHDVFGLASIAVAVLALWRRSRPLAYLAVASGVVGMVLYNFTWAGAGVIGGAMILARHARPRQQDGEAEQHAR